MESNTNASPSAFETPKASIPQFASASATEAAKAYFEALAELKSQPPPQINGTSAARDPASVTGSLNALGAKLRTLTQAKAQVEANLAPGEERRWEAYQKSLEQQQQGEQR
jgi:hypothetical protein